MPPQGLRWLPAIDKLLRTPQAEELSRVYGRESLRDALRESLDAARDQIRAGTPVPDVSSLLAAAEARLRSQFAPTLRPVINATGVILHTNLGRAPLSAQAQAAIVAAAAHYSTLEYQLETGKRGKRDQHAESLLKLITGAAGALVVNNNAAAVTLILAALAKDQQVLISRGQLVEIGGGFRMPDVMHQSGAIMVEVGTTNKTRLEDFARAITPQSALILRVHTSNFKQIGFTEQPELSDLTALAHERLLVAADDLGSGALVDTAAFGLDHEPTIQESLQSGCDLVAFSGDKLLGGPQAGIIVGRADLIERLKRHPLARAFRIDKLSLAGLVATLEHYRRGEALSHIPVWQMISAPVKALHHRAAAWQSQVGGEVMPSFSTVGGGSLPGESLPTYVLALRSDSAEALSAALRRAPMPVIGRIAADQVLLDPRTVLPDQESTLVEMLRLVLKEPRGK